MTMKSRAQTVDNATSRNTARRGDHWANRHDDSNNSRVEFERTRQIKRPDHQRRHHHRRDERAHGEACTQHRIAKHRQPDQR